MDSNQIRLTGSFELPSPVEIDKNYTLTVSADIVSVSKHSNDDGSYTYVYRAKVLTGEASDGQKVIKLVDKTHHSAKLRAQLGFLATERGLEPEQFYNAVMGDLRHNLLMVLDLLEGIK